MLRNFVKNIFLAFVVLICCHFSASSQDTCNLRLNVYEFKENGESENFPVKNYTIKLINAKTKKLVKTREVGGDAFVSSIDKGSYIATISKDGFQKTETKLWLDCSLTDSQNTATEIAFLWKGDSRKLFKSYFDGDVGTFIVAKKQDSDSKPLNNGAVTLARPEYPRAARVYRASGKVEVQVLINELGYVISAKAVSGHPILQTAAVEAAQKSKFKMTLLEGIPVKVNGIVVYNFVT